MAALSVATFVGGSDVVKYYCCTICENERSVEVDADFYCKKCLKYFCGTCIHSHRQHGRWFYKQSPYGKDKMMKWPLSKKMEDSLLACVIHKVEKLAMYCPDHSQLCCSKCVELNHRLCLQVTPLPQATKEKSTDFKNLSVKSENTLSRMKQFQTYQEDTVKSLKVSYDEHERRIVDGMRLNITSFILQCETCTVNTTHEHIQYTVNGMREKINYLLADFEESTVKAIKEELTLTKAHLMSVRYSCIRLHDELFHLHVAIHKVLDRPELFFIASKKILEILEIIQQSDIFLKENFEVLTVNGHYTHNVRIPSDSEECSITGCCVLPDGQILVVDNRNMKVKLLNQQYQILDLWGGTAGPHDICMITPSEVAVAVDDYNNTHEVRFIKVVQSQLVAGRKLQLQHICLGIAHHQGDLYICSGTALYKYTVSGKQVCRLFEDVQAVLQVDSDGSRKLATLATQERDGVWWPVSVCYNSFTSSIIVDWYNEILVLRVE